MRGSRTHSAADYPSASRTPPSSTEIEGRCAPMASHHRQHGRMQQPHSGSGRHVRDQRVVQCQEGRYLPPDHHALLKIPNDDTSVRAATMNGVQYAKKAQTSTPRLLSSRSTCFKIPERRVIETSGEAIVDLGYAWGLDNAFKMVTKHLAAGMARRALNRYRSLGTLGGDQVGLDLHAHPASWSPKPGWPREHEQRRPLSGAGVGGMHRRRIAWANR